VISNQETEFRMMIAWGLYRRR